MLETLRRIEVATSIGRMARLLDEVDLITGISGGSFTALAYGLYGERLFDEYEKRFLKHDVFVSLSTRLKGSGSRARGRRAHAGELREVLSADLSHRRY